MLFRNVVFFLALVFLGACSAVKSISFGKRLDPSSPPSMGKAANFSLKTLSSFDTPMATWDLLNVDESFSHFECQVERLHQISGEITESGDWKACSSPYDLRSAAGIDVSVGFHGQ